MIGQEQVPGTSAWFNAWGWHSPVTGQLLLDHLVTGRAIELANATWSLHHEIRISFLMPLLVIATERNWKATLGGAWLLAFVVALLEGMFGQPDWMASWPNTIIFIALFATGAALALAGNPVLRAIERLPRILVTGMVTISLLVLTYGNAGIGPIQAGRPFLTLFVTTGAAALLLAVAMTPSRFATKVLEHRLPLYLGRISYSLYLVHLVVLQALVRVGDGRLSPIATIALVLPASIVAAHILQSTVEVGSQRLGRHLAMMVSNRHRVAESGFGG